VQGHLIPAGSLVGASPSVSNRLADAFADPEGFDPHRYIDPRADDVDNPWSWIPFGAGRHRCVGAAFAMMQLKAIFSVLLRQFTFELTQPSDTYRNDHSKMVVQLAQPCAARMLPRSVAAEHRDAVHSVHRPRTTAAQWRIVVDRDLCQGHGVCESEAPGLFEVSKDGVLTVLQDTPQDADRPAAELAVQYCPTHALSIVEEP
jgi:sterol 14-demethylase